MIPRCFVLVAVLCCALSNPVTEFAEEEDPDTPVPQRPSQLLATRIVDHGSAAELEKEATANASHALSNISFADIENDNLTHSLHLRYRERKKQERLSAIQAQILGRLRSGGRLHVNASTPKFSAEEQQRIAQFVRRAHLLHSAPPAPPALRRLQSFYPACSLPNHTDKNTWESEGTFRVFYDVPLNRRSPHSQLAVLLAKLRLFKVTGNADPNFVDWSAEQTTLPRYNLLDSLVNARAANAINVYIYQYVKPLKANKKEKKRLVDTRMLSVDYEGWVEFNVIASLNSWLQHSSRNFGFDVEVEDSFGNKLDPNLYFRNMNCSSGEGRDPPFPNIMELHSELFENESSLVDNEAFPTLDLQTLETDVEDFPDVMLADRGLDDHLIRKRSSGEIQQNCTGERVYVSFDEIGLGDVIIVPHGVVWTFCEGKCDTDDNKVDTRTSQETNEHFIARWIHRLMKNIKKSQADSACKVSQRVPLRIIIYDSRMTESSTHSTVLEDLVPVQCSCKVT